LIEKWKFYAEKNLTVFSNIKTKLIISSVK
jgi:hypothetical protein